MWKTRLALILVAIAAIRIASTYTIFSEGIDEPVHLAAGLQIFQEHRYNVQTGNPPLPRFLFALGPWLDGMRLDKFDLRIHQRPSFVFQSGKGHRRTLALSRVGNLVFFLIAAVATLSWARREAGDAAALATVFFFTTQPVVLGWSGLIAQDIAGTAGVAVSLLAFTRWLEKPSMARAIGVGAAYGFAIACKFSCLPYVPVACLALIAVRMVAAKRWLLDRRTLATMAVAPVATAIVIWASYGFSWGSAIQGAVRIGSVPAPRFVEGVLQMVLINRRGIESYLWGRTSTTGWWWYFPATLALKSTLAFLTIVMAGFFLRPPRIFFEATAAAAAILAVAMTSTLDVGIRYVVPVFVPLSVAAGVALFRLWEQRAAALRFAAVAVIAWQAGASAMAHPDYFPYFNALAGQDPSRYLADSNLDWGQDAFRLASGARHLKIPRLGIAIFSNVDLQSLRLPPFYRPNGFDRGSGWIAVSDQIYRIEGSDGAWRWLTGRPYRRVGKSIRLYFIGGQQ
jgi:4-amino-4-deoxy-L-arabinose transferase-like glycosyltransferase